MPRRAARASGPGTRRGLLERFLFSFMGPPQLGGANEPPAARDEAAERCPRCRRTWDEHEHVRTASHSYMTCPPAQRQP